MSLQLHLLNTKATAAKMNKQLQFAAQVACRYLFHSMLYVAQRAFAYWQLESDEIGSFQSLLTISKKMENTTSMRQD